jgi:hypothetical protein
MDDMDDLDVAAELPRSRASLTRREQARASRPSDTRIMIRSG